MQILGDLFKGDHTEVSTDKKKIIEAVNLLGDTVGSTLGAAGKTALIKTSEGPYSTKDGYYISTLINPEDDVMQLPVQAIRQAAEALARYEGDGTTTCTVLAQSIITEAFKKTKNPSVGFIQGLMDAAAAVIKELDKATVEMTPEYIYKIALTSVNQDVELAETIAGIFKEIGEDGAVGFVIDPNATKTTAEVVAGSTFPLGYSLPEFINNVENQSVDLQGAHILVSNAEIKNAAQIKPILEYIAEDKKPLVVIAQADEKFERSMVQNRVKNNHGLCVIKPDHTVDAEMLKDLAAVTGATYFDGFSGDALDSITPDMLGHVDLIRIQERDTRFETKNPGDVSERLALVEKMLKETSSELETKKLQTRKGILKGGIGKVIIGANTRIEAQEIKDRVEDGIKAIASSVHGGFLPGGGIALLDASNAVKPAEGKSSYAEGYNTLLKAVSGPFRRILSNAGLDIPKGVGNGVGVDVMSGALVDMIEAGIIDPAMVTKRALMASISPSIRILRTGAIITPIQKEDEKGSK